MFVMFVKVNENKIDGCVCRRGRIKICSKKYIKPNLWNKYNNKNARG